MTNISQCHLYRHSEKGHLLIREKWLESRIWSLGSGQGRGFGKLFVKVCNISAVQEK